MRTILAAALGLVVVSTIPALVAAQTSSAPRSRYPFPPKPLPVEEEIALAVSAAPAEVSANADVHVLRGTEFTKVRSGTNGCACMVARDLHEGSLYPLCFDQEGARTLMLREMRETSLRASGLTEDEVKSRIAAEVSSGALPKATRPTLAYMMSPHQVLFSSSDSSGFRVGAWHPHIMMSKVGMSREQVGFTARSRYPVVQAGGEAGTLHELVVILPVWSDGKPAPAPRVAQP